MTKLIGFFLFSFLLTTYSFAEEPKAPRILYVTSLPGTYHDYVTQREIFQETAKRAGWDVTVIIGSYKTLNQKGVASNNQKPVVRGTTKESIARYERVMAEISAQKPLLERLKEKNYAKGFDAIVYNVCLAHVTDLDATSNMINQTRELGVPAFLIHCSMHTFWSTFKYKDKQKKLMDEWKKKHPDRPFPNWGNFTGVASTGHGPNFPIETKVMIDHPATKGVVDGYITPPTELYNNAYVTPDTVPLLRGTQKWERKQKDGTTKKMESSSVIMWVSPQGKSRVIGLTIGHGDADLRSEGFQRLLIDGVNWMIEEQTKK